MASDSLTITISVTTALSLLKHVYDFTQNRNGHSNKTIIKELEIIRLRLHEISNHITVIRTLVERYRN